MAKKTQTNASAKSEFRADAASDAGKKPAIFMEGDSWERLPDFGSITPPIVGGTNYDLERALRDLGYSVTSVAHWGDTIAAIARQRDYVEALRSGHFPIFVLGGGGNDLLGDGRLRSLIRVYDNGRKAKDYLKPAFYDALDDVFRSYQTIFNDLKTQDLSAIKVVIHGYDYAKPMRLDWLGKPFEDMGIRLPEHEDLQNAIVKVMIDAFNSMLETVASNWPNVTYVDLRGTVKGRWHDELHPSKEAFVDLARKLSRAL